MRRIAGLACSALLVPVMFFSEANAAPTFNAPKSMQEGTVIEPGVDIGPATVAAPGGEIFVNGPPGFPGHSRLWRSTDGGSSYSRVRFTAPFNQLPGGGDSDVVVTESGRVYFLDLWIGSNSLARSDDGGTTWSFGTPITTLAASDRQWIGVGGPGDLPGTDTVYVAYALIQPPQYAMIARSKDSGVTWTHHKIIPVPGQALNFTGQIVTDASGFVGVIYHERGQMNFAWSSDEGETWSHTAIAGGALNNMPAVALSDGTLHATWISTGWAVMESRSTDGGQTWSAARAVSAAASTNMFSWVDARNDKVAIAWYGTDNGASSPDTNAGPWYVKYSESIDRGVTYSAPVNAVAAPAKTTPICTRGLACDTTGTGNRELGDFLQVAVDRQGKSIIVYDHVFSPNNYIARAVKQAS